MWVDGSDPSIEIISPMVDKSSSVVFFLWKSDRPSSLQGPPSSGPKWGALLLLPMEGIRVLPAIEPARVSGDGIVLSAGLSKTSWRSAGETFISSRNSLNIIEI
eukprot:Gregarina_sp_Poly_1__1703@NODE_1439_length_4149_cov_6_058550_g955_i0_p4_GENE_NODE_1439_length_4149_cov_6_058550_g955_i0NODE_1439_length_4149_cov_6_058550_g955_i0_p4_ORF_typecomplete_len104_score17_02Stealth_CR1/PF17101_5/0_16_NODE_1439_length_4149_cov_6_058550_g955_i0439750